MQMAKFVVDALVKPMAIAVVAVVGALAATSAYADAADTFNASVSYSVLHDDNLFRLSPGAAIDSRYAPKYDTVQTLGVTGSIDKPISRQQLHADITLEDVRYQEHRFLNNQPFRATASWAWQLGENLSGLLKHANTRNISSFENYQSVMKDVYRTHTDSASARYRFHPDWFVEGFAQTYTATHSLLLTSDVDIRETRVSIITQRPGGDQIQGRLIRRDGNYPNSGGGIDYQYNERQLDAIMTLVLSGASSVTASFGHLQRRYPYAPDHDFSGQIGRLAWNWLPTGKLSLIASVERSLGVREDILTTYALTETLHLGATWSATDRITLQASVDRWRSDYRGNFALPSWLPWRRDDGRRLSLGAGYQIQRNLLVSAQWAWSRRDSNYADLGIPYYSGQPYRDNLFWLSLQYSF